MVNISGISGSAGTQQQQNIRRSNEKLQAAIASLVSGVRLNRASDDVAALSVATQLQSQNVSLRQVSSNLAQASSLAQVADGGAEQIAGLLEKLQNVAQQAGNATLSDDNRAQLNVQFQQLKAAIDRFADNTTFNGQKLLDGSLTGGKSLSLDSLLTGEPSSGDAVKLSVDSLTSSSLFAGENLDVLSADGAQRSLDAIGAAIGKVTGARASIGSFQEAINYAGASIDSAAANQEAALSILQDTDFASASTDSVLASLQRNAGIALAAQGNRLSPTLLKLVS